MVKTFQHIKLKKKCIMSNYLITVMVVTKHIEGEHSKHTTSLFSCKEGF